MVRKQTIKGCLSVGRFKEIRSCLVNCFRGFQRSKTLWTTVINKQVRDIFERLELPWVVKPTSKSPWTAIAASLPTFRMLTRMEVRNEKKTQFWHDVWAGQPTERHFARIFALDFWKKGEYTNLLANLRGICTFAGQFRKKKCRKWALGHPHSPTFGCN